MKELRKDIPWYIGRYKISDGWRVKSLAMKFKTKSWRMTWKREKILKPWKTWNSRHYRVSLMDDNWNNKKQQISRLVYCVFNNIEIWCSWFENLILHKNDITRDNRLENLYLWTQSDNMKDRYNNTNFKKNILLVI